MEPIIMWSELGMVSHNTAKAMTSQGASSRLRPKLSNTKQVSSNAHDKVLTMMGSVVPSLLLNHCDKV